MTSVLRAVAIYLILLVVFRIAGRRTLSSMTSFDLVLTLIISEAVQQAMLADDNSMTNGVLVVITLVLTDILFALVKRSSRRMEKWIDGVPTIIVDNGQPLHSRMRLARVDENDVLSAARELQGLSSLTQIRYAVLEANGKITIVPKSEA